ncbi:hypothetical protein BDV93DRAFT_565030 [Ceratobasidium sp. AG-I]|nr:hypothetical protein BDV93DRAFT_565030 [Ceratobasidium sp. AG-I]
MDDLRNPSSSLGRPKLRRLDAKYGLQERSNATRYSNAKATRTNVDRIPKTPTVPRTIVVPATPPNEHISTNTQEHPVPASSPSNHSVASSSLSVCTLPMPAFSSDQMLDCVELPSMASLSPSPVRLQRGAKLAIQTSISSNSSNSFFIPNTSTSFISQWTLPPAHVVISPSPTRQTRSTQQTANIHLVVNSPMPTFVSDMTSLMGDDLPSTAWWVSPAFAGSAGRITGSLLPSRSLSPSPVRPVRRRKRNRADISELDTSRAPTDLEDVFSVGLQVQPMNDTPDIIDWHCVNTRAIITESPVKRKRTGHLLPQIGFPLDVSLVIDRSFVEHSCSSSELFARLGLPSFASSGLGFAPLSVDCDERLSAIPNAPYCPTGDDPAQSLMIPSCSLAELFARVELPSFASSQSSFYPAPPLSAAVQHARQSSGRRLNPIPPTPPSLKRILALITPPDQSLATPSRSPEMLTRIELPSMASTSSTASAVVLYPRTRSPTLTTAYRLRELLDRPPPSSRSGTPRSRVKPTSGLQTFRKVDTNRFPVRLTEIGSRSVSFSTESSLKISNCPPSDTLTQLLLPSSSSLQVNLDPFST